jgi:hypothetical protein
VRVTAVTEEKSGAFKLATAEIDLRQHDEALVNIVVTDAYQFRGRIPLDRLVTYYDFAELNWVAADALTGTTTEPAPRLPQ